MEADTLKVPFAFAPLSVVIFTANGIPKLLEYGMSGLGETKLATYPEKSSANPAPDSPPEVPLAVR